MNAVVACLALGAAGMHAHAFNAEIGCVQKLRFVSAIKTVLAESLGRPCLRYSTHYNKA
jgi:hypothetical protein